MFKKCMSYLKNILKFNWIRDLLFASIVYTLMVSFSIVRMPLCSFLPQSSCATIQEVAFHIVFVLSYFFALYVLYLFVKFIVYIIYKLYTFVASLKIKGKSSKSAMPVAKPVVSSKVSASKSKKPVAKKAVAQKTTKKKSKTSKK